MDSLKSFVFDSEILAAKLIEGSAAAFPTDTVPALASCPKEASLLWKIKRRPLDKPLILLGSNVDELFEFVAPKALFDARLMAERYWPGALTMVLPVSGPFVESLNPGSLTLGMRIPACKVARDLLDLSGPLATTSANLSGAHPLLTAKDVACCFPDVPLLGPLPWPKASGLASTVLLWQSKECWTLLRKGSVLPPPQLCKS